MSTEIEQNTTDLEALLEQANNLPNAIEVGGENGATFKPYVDGAGNLSWTNDKGLANPDPVNIRGPKGETPEVQIYNTFDESDGRYGVYISGPKIVDQNGDFISNSGIVWDGKDGVNGYNPVKGVDYWTEEDKQAILADLDKVVEYPITSVNGKTGEVELSASDVGALPDTTKIPNTLSDLTTDSTHRTVTDTEKNTWNAKANTTDIPTKVSDLTNDKGYLTSYTETDPTVPAWAKADTKPTYTKTEIGLGNVDNVKQYSTNNPPVLVRSEAPEDKSVIWVDPDDESKEETLEIKESIIAEYGAIYSTFPTEEEILAMPNRTYFTVRTSLEQANKLASYYRTTSWKPGAFEYIDADGNKIYVLPLNQSDGELYMPNYGIKTGEANAANNSALMEKIISWASYGATIRFPVGRFFFSRPINITKHLQIIGASTTAHYDESLTGTTILVFPNLRPGETAISMDQGTISNLTIAGTTHQYDFRIERNEDGDSSTPPEVTVQEAIPGNLGNNESYTYGLKASATMKIHNVGVRNFYYGIWCDVGNISITNITCRHCCYGLSIANDTKVINLFGADNSVLLQIRGSLSSAIGLRCDDVGEHLVEIIGSCSCITLMDLDAEFCMGAIIAVGDGVNSTNLKALEVSGVHGRSSVSQRYNKNNTEITAKDATADTADDFGVITIKNNSILNGAIITTNQRPADNSPFDHDQEKNYVVPYVLLTAGEGTIAKNIQITAIGDFGDENPQEWASKRIASFSNLEDACSVKVQTYTGYIKYTKSNGITTIIDDATDMYQKMGLDAKFAQLS